MGVVHVFLDEYYCSSSSSTESVRSIFYCSLVFQVSAAAFDMFLGEV